MNRAGNRAREGEKAKLALSSRIPRQGSGAWISPLDDLEVGGMNDND
jgi:hypothetical protein